MTTIRVPFDVHRLSLNQRLHWRERNRRNVAAKEATAYAYRKAGEPRFTEPVRLSLVVRRGRRIDRDNAITGAKPIVDALVRAGMVPDDNADWVSWGTVSFECSKDWGRRPQVVVLVETMNK